MKIGIVGTGISGLTAAHYLYPHHDLTLFEADQRVGGHTHTVQVEQDDEVQQVDTGFIVFNEVNYPGFRSLLQDLGIESQPTTMSFSVADADGKLEYNGTNLNRLFAQRSNLFRPRFYRMIRDILQFNRDIKESLESDENQSVNEFLTDKKYGRLFADRYLLPLGAALWSCPTETFGEFPIRFVGEFLANHFMLQIGGRPQWRVIKQGSSRYVEKLIQPFEDRIHRNCPAEKVLREQGKAIVIAQGQRFEFDHVIMACHADQALGLLEKPSATESELLGLFPYQKNEVYLHTDETVLPQRKLAWAAWNAKIYPQAGGTEKAVVSYNMNMLQSLDSKRTYCVTLNEADLIDPDKMIRQITYHHPLFTVSRSEAVQKHEQLLDANQTSFCGAYWGYGFHEDGVQSALRVVKAIDKNAVPYKAEGVAV